MLKYEQKFKKYKYDNSNLNYQNNRTIDPNQNNINYYKEISKDNSKYKMKDLTYYSQLINTMNEELDSVNNNLNIEENKEDKLLELENNRQYLLEKNNEIEEQIKKLQNLSQKINCINDKSSCYNNSNNSQEEIPKQNYSLFNTFDSNYNYSIDNQNNSVKYSNYSNITQDRNNYINIEDDSLEFFLDKNKNNSNNINIYEDIHNHYNKKRNITNQEIKNGNNLNSKASISSRNVNQANVISNYFNYIKKNKTFNYNRKKSHESLRMNIRYHKNNDNKLIKNQSKNSIISNKDKIKEKKYNYKYQNELNDKFESIKIIINQLNNKNINKNTKNYLINKIKDLKNDYNFKISALENKYIEDTNKKTRRIKKLEIENQNLKKKVTKIKSIV
jgi:hypothetical protein